MFTLTNSLEVKLQMNKIYTYTLKLEKTGHLKKKLFDHRSFWTEEAVIMTCAKGS